MLPASAIALADLDDELPTKTSEARLRAETDTATDLMAVRPPMASEPPTIERVAPGLPCLAEIRALAETADPDVTRDDPTLAPAQPAVDHEDPTLAPPRPSASLAIFPATARTVLVPEALDAEPPAKSAQVLPMPPPRPASAPRPLAIVPSLQSTPRIASAPPPASSPPPPVTFAASPPMSAPRGMRVRSLVVLVLVLAFFSGMGSTFGFEVLSHAAPLPLRSPRAIEGDATKLSLEGGGHRAPRGFARARTTAAPAATAPPCVAAPGTGDGVERRSRRAPRRRRRQRRRTAFGRRGGRRRGAPPRVLTPSRDPPSVARVRRVRHFSIFAVLQISTNASSAGCKAGSWSHTLHSFSSDAPSSYQAA